ncbi:hypothetical protein M440DRAFT_1452983 [Trichoderma longibrachiatum ATCC 18648]|uniref:Uncharacterized protein n=1 Tax=Trichoderma longibrachiatum ATCC 18648 TaxID=983965 RepID=A0A2T4CCS4_TRILO|nr:hypothetical protein M440DRAFT_1452983 [Trichoderma longibrachiatum ATCC 18648]
MADRKPTNKHPIVFIDIPKHLTNQQIESVTKDFRRFQRGYDGDDKLPAEIPPEEYLIHCKHLVEGVVKDYQHWTMMIIGSVSNNDYATNARGSPRQDGSRLQVRHNKWSRVQPP